MQIPPISIKNYAKCSRYIGHVVQNVKIAPSDRLIASRLRKCGVRPINNMVDITNYVLKEIGQPLHAFDYSLVSQGISIDVASQGESIMALNGVEYAVGDMLVIRGNGIPVAIAGVMGGEHSGVTDQTTTVVMEAARFQKAGVRTVSRSLGLRSDSSSRFEKGIDWLSVENGMNRALSLISQYKIGQITSQCADVFETKPSVNVITTSAKQISELLGIDVSKTIVTKLLSRLGFDVQAKGNVLTVTVPLFREDIDNYTDLAEEVIRYHGYDNLTPTYLPHAQSTVGGMSQVGKNIDYLRSLAASFGFSEIITYSFINENAVQKLGITDSRTNQIRLSNPLSAEFAVMRTQAVSSMLQSVALNLNRKNNQFCLFEVAKTYLPHQLPLSDYPIERDILCLSTTGTKDFYFLKCFIVKICQVFGIDIEFQRSAQPYYNPYASADVFTSEGKHLASFGQLHPLTLEKFDIKERVFLAEIDLSLFEEPQKTIKMQPIPKFPVVVRDLCLICDIDTPVGDLIATIKSNAGEDCKDVKLFDVYTGEQIAQGFKSVALTIRYSADRTLKDQEVNASIEAILAALLDKHNAKLR